MLAQIVQAVNEARDPDTTEAAIDSTGMGKTSASAHYKTRSGRDRRQYVKLSVCVV